MVMWGQVKCSVQGIRGTSYRIWVSVRCASWIRWQDSTKGEVKAIKAGVSDKDRVDKGRQKG